MKVEGKENEKRLNLKPTKTQATEIKAMKVKSQRN